MRTAYTLFTYVNEKLLTLSLFSWQGIGTGTTAVGSLGYDLLFYFNFTLRSFIGTRTCTVFIFVPFVITNFVSQSRAHFYPHKMDKIGIS